MQPKGTQFDMYREESRSSSGRTYGYTYHVGTTNESGSAVQTAGRLQVRPPRPSTETAFPRSLPGGTQEMFLHTPSVRSQPEVYAMFVGKETGMAMPATMLGVAQNDMYRMYGSKATMMPPDDLSRESSRLSSHLKKAGVLPPEASSTQSNEYTDEDVSRSNRETSGMTKVSLTERQAGLKTIKSVLGRNRERQQPSQGTQLQLPGMG